MPIAYEYHGPRTSVQVGERFAVPADVLFDAWITPEVAAKWLFTNKSSRAEYNLDARPGGQYTIIRKSGDKTYTAVGEYREIDRPHKLVFTFGMPQFAADFDTITVRLAPDPETGGSIMTVTQDGLRPGYERSTTNGWKKMFAALAAALSPQPVKAKRPLL